MSHFQNIFFFIWASTKKKMSLFLPQTSYNGAYQIHVPMSQVVSHSWFPIQNLLYFQKTFIKFHKSHGILAQNANLLKNGFVSVQQFQRHFSSQTSYNGAYQIHVPMGQGVSQSCFPIQNLLYFQKIIIKFHKSHGILAQITNLLKNGFVQYSSFRDIFTLKIAISELTKSMFPWVKG